MPGSGRSATSGVFPGTPADRVVPCRQARRRGAVTEVLTRRRLNRATLARQLLLEPARLGLVDAVEQIGGLQAQEPASPYIGLWARLRDFGVGDLDAAIAGARRRQGHADAIHAPPRLGRRLPRARGRRSCRCSRRSGARIASSHRPPATCRAVRRRVTAFTATPRASPTCATMSGSSIGMTADEVVWWLRRRRRSPTRRPGSAGRMAVGRSSRTPTRGCDAGDCSPTRPPRSNASSGGTSARSGPRRSPMWRTGRDLVARIRPAVEAIEMAGDLRRFSGESGAKLDRPHRRPVA